jgi:hypothetical protein
VNDDRLRVVRRALSPTDVAQYVRLDRCDRYLRLRLHERSEGRGFLKEFGTLQQAIPPLLTLSGAAFEDQLESSMRRRHRLINYKHEAQLRGGRRGADNDRIVAEANALVVGEVVVLCQARLQVSLGDWQVTGEIDILRLERGADGRLGILLADAKSSTAARIEHRLQVAFYLVMLARLFEEGGVPFDSDGARIAILFRGPAEHATEEDPAALALRAEQRALAESQLGAGTGLLEIVEDRAAYLAEVETLVTGRDSAAERIAALPFDRLQFTLGYKCDGCLYNPFCMKDVMTRDDLSLVPYMDLRVKKALQANRIATAGALAALKEPDAPGAESHSPGVLVAASGTAPEVLRSLGGSAAGARLDELVLRARTLPRARQLGLSSRRVIPGGGQTSLPYVAPDHNPNLVCLFVSVLHDYLLDRVGMLSARVVAYEQGVPARACNIVRLADGPPDSAGREEDLLRRWVTETLEAVYSLAAPEAPGKHRAPVHLVFWNDFEQRMLLAGLARCFARMGRAASALYDFMTQMPSFDSPIASCLDDEIRRHRNYPILCPSLQNVATYLKFDWTGAGGEDYRAIFRERMFDSGGRIDETGEYFTRFARYNSQIPLEYAYIAWGAAPTPAGHDLFERYRGATRQTLTGFSARRLEAMERIARDIGGNNRTTKEAFELRSLASYEDTAHTLAQALREFVMIERHTSLGAWKARLHQPAERRALQGETLLVSYHAEDQTPGSRQTRLRLEAGQADADLDTIVRLNDASEGQWFVLYPLLTVDERLPEAERVPFQPTPKQMLYGPRVALTHREFDVSEGRITGGFLTVEPAQAFGGAWSQGFLFRYIDRPLVDGQLMTLDSDPNDIYGYWELKVVEGLLQLETAGRPQDHTLYSWLAAPERAPRRLERSAEFLAGQARFLEGLDALHAVGAMPDFEPAKREFIGTHGDDPLLLVQGPPGTGKSYGSGYATWARMQGALAAGMPFRVLLSCKTHSATDVLLKDVHRVLLQLSEARKQHRELWDRYFDDRLFEVPLMRLDPQGDLPPGIVGIGKDNKKAADVLAGNAYGIAAATCGGTYRVVKDRWGNDRLFGHHFCDLLLLDEASQLSLPEAMMASLPLHSQGQLLVVGDPRQMPPIVQHDWKREARRTFRQYRAYESLFDALAPLSPPRLGFARSFRLHAVLADVLCEEIYRHDGIAYYSERTDLLPAREFEDAFVAAVLSSGHPLVVVVHDEAESENVNLFETALLGPVVQALVASDGHALRADTGFGVVVPHRAQRMALRRAYPELIVTDPATGDELRSAVDTVERYQGDEREVILVSATESDPDYLRASAGFLLEPRRLTVALSRAKTKLVLVASRSVFEFFTSDEELFASSQIWKNLVRHICHETLWEGVREGMRVRVCGCPASCGRGNAASAASTIQEVEA